MPPTREIKWLTMSQEQQIATLDMCQANVHLQLHNYVAIRRWFRAVGVDSTELDEMANQLDKPPPDLTPASGDAPGKGFRKDAPWVQGPG